MTINTYIADSATKLKVEVIENGDKKSLVVATHPLKMYDHTLRFFTNDEYGVELNVNAATGGTPELIHDGLDTVAWTASDIVDDAKTTFNSSDVSYDGAGSVKVDNADDNSVFQFARATPLDCSGYVSLSMYIWVDKDWKAGDVVSLYGWDTATNTQVGTAIDLKNYFSYDTVDVWHRLIIDLHDLGTLAGSSIDAIRIKQTASEGKAPKYYIDVLEFEETGEPIQFGVEPDKGTWLYVESMQLLIADAYVGTLADASMPNIPYDSFFGVPKLVSGIRLSNVIDGGIVSSFSIKQFSDFLLFPSSHITGSGSDGTNSWVSVSLVFAMPVLLKAEDQDGFYVTINDDLSGLLDFRISVGARIENRQKESVI